VVSVVPGVEKRIPERSGVGLVNENEGKGKIEVGNCVIVNAGGSIDGVRAIGTVDEGLWISTYVSRRSIMGCTRLGCSMVGRTRASCIPESRERALLPVCRICPFSIRGIGTPGHSSAESTTHMLALR
jgi:hypothetical protein